MKNTLTVGIAAGLLLTVMNGAHADNLVDVSTGFCLDSNLGGNVYTLPCNGGNFQNWQGRGQTLVDVWTGFCLDSNLAGNVYTLPCNGGNFQNWQGRGQTLVD